MADRDAEEAAVGRAMTLLGAVALLGLLAAPWWSDRQDGETVVVTGWLSLYGGLGGQVTDEPASYEAATFIVGLLPPLAVLVAVVVGLVFALRAGDRLSSAVVVTAVIAGLGQLGLLMIGTRGSSSQSSGEGLRLTWLWILLAVGLTLGGSFKWKSTR